VGQKRPNDLGLFDVHGNVWAWCQDPGYYYPKQQEAATTDDQEDNNDVTDGSTRVLRGGSFLSQPAAVRSSFRNNLRPSVRTNFDGLRVARTYD
jgi:formylglycine-generating enzyme required for sulfatase activity